MAMAFHPSSSELMFHGVPRPDRLRGSFRGPCLSVKAKSEHPPAPGGTLYPSLFLPFSLQTAPESAAPGSLSHSACSRHSPMQPLDSQIGRIGSPCAGSSPRTMVLWKAPAAGDPDPTGDQIHCPHRP